MRTKVRPSADGCGVVSEESYAADNFSVAGIVAARRKGTRDRQSALIIVAWLLMCLIWGSTWPLMRVGLRHLPPISFAGVRVLLSALGLSLIVIVRRAQLPRGARDWWLMAVTGTLMFTVNYSFIFWGLQHVSAGLGALLNTTSPIFGFLLAHYHLPAERLTLAKLVGVMLGASGVALIFSNQMNAASPLAFWGGAAILLSALSVAYANVLIKARGAHLDRSVLVTGQMCFGLLPMLLLGFIKEGNPLRFRWTLADAGALLYLVLVGSIVGFLLFYWLVRQIDVTKTMLIYLVTPLVAVSLGMLLLGESLTWRVALGGGAIMAGVGLIVTRRVKRG